MPVGCVHRLRKKNCCDPLRTPEPVHVATMTGDDLLSVPAAKPTPLPVQGMLDAGMTVTPERRSSAACTLSTTCAPPFARDLAVMRSGPPVAETWGTAS